MIIQFNCRPTSANPGATSLVFAWNPDTGEVTGRDAPLIRDMATWKRVSAHPLPWAWDLSAEPLRSYVDMAALVGSHWVLPDELVAHYPQVPDDGIPEATFVDADGVTVLGRDLLTY